MNNLLAVNISDISSWLNTGPYSDVNTLVNGKIITAINFFVLFSAVIAVIMLIVAGYTFITSAGDADKVDKASKTLTAAIVGMVVVFVAKILVQYILSIVGQ